MKDCMLIISSGFDGTGRLALVRARSVLLEPNCVKKADIHPENMDLMIANIVEFVILLPPSMKPMCTAISTMPWAPLQQDRQLQTTNCDQQQHGHVPGSAI
jgi:hypothetical protein